MHELWLSEIDGLTKPVTPEQREKIALLYYLYPYDSGNNKNRLKSLFLTIYNSPLDSLRKKANSSILPKPIRELMLNRVGEIITHKTACERPGFALIYLINSIRDGNRPKDVYTGARKYITTSSIDAYMTKNYSGTLKEITMPLPKAPQGTSHKNGHRNTKVLNHTKPHITPEGTKIYEPTR